ncbi:hypothetical protein EXM22_07540 [Oceanispirochaeta crateris]|uniref:Glycoside hydrolase family 9 domain-containing protein n=1 Tax=Oceanispirochaeta crateris TaxID=2518645 RepID=A0A5C1QLK1_9SPIO|nr:glycoside hydrolase family 9 protein [Oceanispirochaeta crateris]QEN07850.1 hypothetical protein EXM22_07540 [Oceanispirochaeta crateris]
MIHVNQKGYSFQSGFRGVFQNSTGAALKQAQLVDAHSGNVLCDLDISPVEAVPGWKNRYFQKLGCPLKTLEAHMPSSFRCRIAAQGEDCLQFSENFTIRHELISEKDLSDLLVYFKTMRCDGLFDEADKHAPVWGTQEERDVSGGWYDASGDTSKYLSHLSYAGRMSPQQTPLVVWIFADVLKRYDKAQLWQGDNFRRWILFEMDYGADFLLKMQHEEGWFYKTLFDQWSKDPEARMLCSYKTQKGERLETMKAGFREGGGMSCAALAGAAALARGEKRSMYTRAAEQGYSYLKEHNAELLEGGPENLIDRYCALLATVELAELKGTGPYIQDAEVYLEQIDASFHSFTPDQGWWFVDQKNTVPFYHASDEGLLFLALQKSLVLPLGNLLKRRVRTMLQKAYSFLERSLLCDPNPFLYPRHWVDSGTDPQFKWFYPHKNPSAYWWQGENSRISSLGAAALSGVSGGLISMDKARKTALASLNWQLGVNPFNLSMVDGWGASNPDYEGDYYNLPGGVANGITSGFEDESDIAFQPEQRGNPGDNSWRWGEQWIPHAAWFFLLTSLIREENL